MTSIDETPIVIRRRSLSKPLHVGRLQTPKRLNSTRDELLSSPILGNVPQNDDESEKRQRRRDKIEQLQRDNVGSPLTPAERRKSLGGGISGLTNAQLADHYANCMKLSAENKINAKNAFGLHLIDYMAEFLRTCDGQTNFQVASCTLDASAKIYASRVDCVYASTFKIASGLNIAKESEKNEEQGDDSGDDGEKGSENKTKKKGKKLKKSSTIEQNPASLNYKKLDIGLQVDPLLIKMSGEFDTAGLNGFLFNTVIAHDGCELIINSKTKPSSYIASEENVHMDIPKLKGILRSIQEPNVEICPQLPDCSFLNSNTSTAEISNIQDDSLLPPQKRCRNFLESMSTANNVLETNIVYIDNEDEELFNDNMDDGAELTDYFANETMKNTNESMANRDYREKILSKARLKNITDMASVLADEPSEYSYFNHSLLCAWAGPRHWKLLQGNHNIGSKRTESENKSKRRTAKIFKYNYTEVKDLESHFVLNQKSNLLTKKTMDNWNCERTTLPEDLHYDVRKLCQLFIKPIKIRRTIDPVEVNDENNDYNYNNRNDCENFCPNVQNESSDIESDMTGLPVDGNITMINDSNVANAEGLEKQHLSPIAECEQAGGLGSLVTEPYKVPKIDIKYARTAKRIDIKQLKMRMWDVLTKCDEGNKENVQNDTILQKMDRKLGFLSLYTSLPSFVSSSMANNLSVPITFVTLLHLVNEKNLALEGFPDLSDFLISQG